MGEGMHMPETRKWHRDCADASELGNSAATYEVYKRQVLECVAEYEPDEQQQPADYKAYAAYKCKVVEAFALQEQKLIQALWNTPWLTTASMAEVSFTYRAYDPLGMLSFRTIHETSSAIPPTSTSSLIATTPSTAPVSRSSSAKPNLKRARSNDEDGVEVGEEHSEYDHSFLEFEPHSEFEYVFKVEAQTENPTPALSLRKRARSPSGEQGDDEESARKRRRS